MNHQCRTTEVNSEHPNRGRARSRWWAARLAGATGLVLTAAVTAGITLPGVDAVGRAVADDQLGKPKGTAVPCDTARLIAEITRANAQGGAVLDLAAGCTYLLTADLDGAGLPAITTPITLNGGKNTTLKRSAAAEEFRILTVNANGRLTLNHLTVTGGKISGDTDGGGILINPGGGATIKKSKIVENVSSEGDAGGIGNIGGALHIEHSVISRNTAANIGGGIFSIGALTVDKSRFDANTALTGGALTVSGHGTITRSELVGHQAAEGGAIFLFGGTTGVIADTRIEKNTTTGLGGSAITGAPLQLTVSRVTIANNTATGGGQGAIFLQGGPALIEDSVIKNNVGVDGGGVYNSGTLTLLRTKVAGNQATASGGGIYNSATGTLTLLRTKVVENAVGTDGGGIFNEVGGTVDISTATGTTVAKNRPDNCVNVPMCLG
ncbi:right-handed parallel beta-helix repeat-containing protein [Salinispora mooreana]|uniref:right-handed parallel beta-helix repeat-containing protein n=1 Tax=Salinispora mooreana TaxID=999545 RepID=UPI0009B79CAC|nr:right-handed parallel beta-helix repeat-containing protein [Salinispora mooreana]